VDNAAPKALCRASLVAGGRVLPLLTKGSDYALFQGFALLAALDELTRADVRAR
jgi:hypothetical protein